MLYTAQSNNTVFFFFIVRCTDMRCLTCSNGVDTCFECIEGYQVDDNTQECITVAAALLSDKIEVSKFIAKILGPVVGVLALLLIVTASIVIAIIVIRRKKMK